MTDPEPAAVAAVAAQRKNIWNAEGPAATSVLMRLGAS